VRAAVKVPFLLSMFAARIVIYRIQNAFAEGEGAARVFLTRHHVGGPQMACKPAALTRSALSQVIPGSAVRVGGLQAAGASLSLCWVCVCALRFNSRFDSRPGGTSLPESD
jgi:hypothetical protein